MKIFIKNIDREVVLEKAVSLEEIAKEYLPKEKFVAARVNGQLKDLRDIVEENWEVEFIADGEEGLEVLRHSAAHLLAQAVLELYPGTKIGIGPATETGFFYDFEREEPFTPEDLEEIEKKMRELADQDLRIEREFWDKGFAIEFFKKQGQDLKVELIQEKGGEKVSVYKQGNFVDFCLGPHVPSTGYIRHFKVLWVSGAYWKGEETNRKLQRIYGTVFFTEKQLRDYLNFLEEAKKRDHRRLGKELELFLITDEIGAGLVLWLPKGGIIRKIIEDFWRDEHLKNGYEIVYTPHIANRKLWATSGHLEFYQENMYPPMQFDNLEYQLKPMNCPFHIVMYKSKLRSYKELPIRWAELGTVYRYERSGVLHGLLRVRGFTQDDAHIFCSFDQLEEEILRTINFNRKILKAFGFEDYEVFLSTRPEEFVGTPEAWDKAEKALASALERAGMEYKIDPGEGVFYGPKIDVKIKDVLGRSWQCSTIQVDFNLPERFKLTYVGEDGKPHVPVMIHRALLGSLERFLGVLIEHYAGAFPLWLAPVQMVVIPIADRHFEYARKIEMRLKEEEFRVEGDYRSEKLGYKIREAQLKKIPFMIIIGDKEVGSGKISLRTRGIGDEGAVELEDFIKRAKALVESKSINLK